MKRRASGTKPSERHLCSRLAIQFEKLLPSYNLGAYYADTEYNRKQEGKIKTIVLGDMQVIKVTCDLIVHSRGEQGRDNLIAIEMAKPNRFTRTGFGLWHSPRGALTTSGLLTVSFTPSMWVDTCRGHSLWSTEPTRLHRLNSSKTALRRLTGEILLFESGLTLSTRSSPIEQLMSGASEMHGLCR